MIQIHLLGAPAIKTLKLHAAAVASAAAKTPPAAVPPLPAIKFRNFSGRGVRLRVLLPEERDVAIECAAKAVGPEATGPEYSARKLREGVNRMLVEVTEQAELTDLGGAKWMKVTQYELEDPKSPKSFGALFTTKDSEMLNNLFNLYHSITSEDLEAVEGNAVEVADAR